MNAISGSGKEGSAVGMRDVTWSLHDEHIYVHGVHQKKREHTYMERACLMGFTN
jgi:hypothetical protein